jgi:hypothetical protein
MNKLLIIATSLSSLLLIGCATSSQETSIQKFAFNDGELQFSRVGCTFVNAQFKNTTASGKGIVYHQATVLDQNKNTIATFAINCNQTVSGGSSSCLVIPQSRNNAGFMCSNFDQVVVNR